MGAPPFHIAPAGRAAHARKDGKAAAAPCPPPPPALPSRRSLASRRPPAGCRRSLDVAAEGDADALANAGCLLFKEGRHALALDAFNQAAAALGPLVRQQPGACPAPALAQAGLGAPACPGTQRSIPRHPHTWPAPPLPQPQLLYNVAACLYQLQQFAPVLQHLAEVVEAGVTAHPELGVGR